MSCAATGAEKGGSGCAKPEYAGDERWSRESRTLPKSKAFVASGKHSLTACLLGEVEPGADFVGLQQLSIKEGAKGLYTSWRDNLQ